VSSHAINLALRFLLELSALGAMGYWSWTQHGGLTRWLLTICLPVISAVIWGTFAVPNDPSRSGSAPIPIPGALRLLIELLLLVGGAYLLIASQQIWLGTVFAAMTVLHYSISYDRIRWLLKSKKE
jgi:hypothetical protein